MVGAICFDVFDENHLAFSVDVGVVIEDAPGRLRRIHDAPWPGDSAFPLAPTQARIQAEVEGGLATSARFHSVLDTSCDFLVV